MKSLRLLAPLLLMCLAPAVAAVPPESQVKLESLTKESDALAKQRYRWEGVQQALLKQKKQIEDTQTAVMQQQSDLNHRSAAHNQQTAAQKQHIADTKADCSNNPENSSGKANACNGDAKNINQASGDLNADVAQLQAEQDSLNARYAQANQDASDWNAHESEAMEHLNKVYHAMNDWLDRAYELIIDPDFRDAVTETNADAYCENRGLPSGTLSINTVKRLSDAYRKCLKYVLQGEYKLRQAAPTATTHP